MALNISGLLDVCARAPTNANANVSFESGAMALLPSPLTTAFFGGTAIERVVALTGRHTLLIALLSDVRRRSTLSGRSMLTWQWAAAPITSSSARSRSCRR